MPGPQISIVLALHEDEHDGLDAIRSVFAQSHRPLELIIVASEWTADAETARKIESPPPGITVQILNGGHISPAKMFDAGVNLATGEYVGLLTGRDCYTPQRVERCLHAAREGSVVISHLIPLDASGSPLGISHSWRVDYDRRLLHHIAAFPSVSSLSVWMDVVVTPGNLFFPRSVWRALGGFEEIEGLHYLDFLLRAGLEKEPVLLREKLLLHKPAEAQPVAAHAAVIRKHFFALWSGTPPANPLADVFSAHPFLLAVAGWTPALSEAYDGLLEYREPAIDVEKNDVTHPPAAPVPRANEFTIITHELSLTGAPVIVLEMATLLQASGARVRILSLKDGPLKAEFRRRGLRVFTPPVLLDRISRLHDLAQHWSLRGNRLPERALHFFAGFLNRLCALAWQFQVLLSVRGTLLANSVASWPLVARLSRRGPHPAYWYIHESLDPQWLMPGDRDNSKLKQLADSGRLKILFGSKATRQHWADNGYNGCVRYWSGITSDTEYLGPASFEGRSTGGRRTILNVGTVSGRKGTRALVEAFAIGRRENLIAADAQLCIVGCARPSLNPEARDLLRRINQPDLRGHVRVVHNVAPAVLASFYREADLYAHASIFDCMPLAVLTAMAHGLPVVTTDVDGCKEAIVHEESGLLVQPGELLQIAAALGRLLEQPDFARQLGQNGRARFIQKFSVEATFPPIYETLIGTAG